MAIKETIKNDIAVFQISGKLMGGNETREVHAKVKESINEGFRKIVIDLSKVKWLNSQGLGMLISSASPWDYSSIDERALHKKFSNSMI